MEKKTVTVTIYDSEEDGAVYPPTAFNEHLAWLQTFVTATPAEHRDSLRVEVNTDSDYGYNATYYRVVYDRPENNEEMSVREAQQQLWDAQRVAQQRAQEVYQRAQEIYQKARAEHTARTAQAQL